MSPKRFPVRSHNAAAGFDDYFRGICGRPCRFLDPAVCRLKPFGSGLGFSRAPSRWGTLYHGRDSILNIEIAPKVNWYSLRQQAISG